MIKGPILQALSLYLVVVALVLVAGTLPAQQKMSSSDIDLVRGILRDARDTVKKNYYDPKYHGIDLDERYRQFDERIRSSLDPVDAGKMFPFEWLPL